MRKYLTLFLSLLLITAVMSGQERTAQYHFVPYDHVVKALGEDFPMLEYVVGKIYLENSLSDKSPQEDVVKGKELLERACKNGVDSAAMLLFGLAEYFDDDTMRFKYSSDGSRARCHLYGIGTQNNPDEALNIYRRNPNAAVFSQSIEKKSNNIFGPTLINSYLYLEDWFLADMLVRRGYTSVDDDLKATLQTLAEANDSEAMLDLAIIYGLTSPEGSAWMARAYEKKNPRSVVALLYAMTVTDHALVMPFGKYPHEILKKVMDETKKIALTKDPIACMIFIKMGENSFYKRDLSKYRLNNDYVFNAAKECRNTLAEMGYPHYQYECYKYRYEKAKPKHIKILEQSANNGYGPAAYELGQRYYDGAWEASAGSEYARNHAMSFLWFMKAAELGYAPAYYEVGYMYEKGEGVTADQAKALEYYFKATEHPVVDLGRFTENTLRAASKIAYAYETGNGLSRSHEKAIIYYLLSAQKDYDKIIDSKRISCPAASLYKMGEFRDYGKGCDENVGQALYWYNMARKHKGYSNLPQPIKEHLDLRIREIGSTEASQPDGLGYYISVDK